MSPVMSRVATITVNGQPWALAGTRLHASLLEFLRDTGATGAKEGCAEGECGACSVMVARARWFRRDAVDRAQLLPGSRRGVRRAGGRDCRGAR